MGQCDLQLIEPTREGILDAFNAGAITSAESVALYLNRIGRYDRSGPALNSAPLVNPQVFEEDGRADAARARGAYL